VGGWGELKRVGGGIRLLSDTMGPVAVTKEPSMVPKPHYKAKQALILITVMDD